MMSVEREQQLAPLTDEGVTNKEITNHLNGFFLKEVEADEARKVKTLESYLNTAGAWCMRQS